MNLTMLTWPQVETYLKTDNRIIIAIGSTEQHGPRAVTGTDHLIAHRLGELLAERTGTIAAPTIPVGMSIHHMEFPGTITLNPSTMILYLKDVLWSLDYQGFHKVLLINGHGGNRGVISSALSEITREIRTLKIRFVCWWEAEGMRELIQEFFGDEEGHHSTPSEVSLMMHLYPGSIADMTLGPHPMPDSNHFSNPDHFRRLFPDGIMGANPDLATQEKGEVLAEKILAGLAKEMNNLKRS
jgi:creatinine amidohydrolase